MRKIMLIICATVIVLSIFAASGCRPLRSVPAETTKPARLTKTVHCDRCGKEVVLDKNSNITEDWIVFCKECGEEVDDVIGVK